MKKTRGLKNNNPLNIRHSKDQWQGARKEQTDKAFVQFESMAYGYRAAWKTLETYWKHFHSTKQPYNVTTSSADGHRPPRTIPKPMSAPCSDSPAWAARRTCRNPRAR